MRLFKEKLLKCDFCGDTVPDYGYISAAQEGWRGVVIECAIEPIGMTFCRVYNEEDFMYACCKHKCQVYFDEYLKRVWDIRAISGMTHLIIPKITLILVQSNQIYEWYIRENKLNPKYCRRVIKLSDLQGYTEENVRVIITKSVLEDIEIGKLAIEAAARFKNIVEYVDFNGF